MYTLVFKFGGKNGYVFDVYHTNEQGRQRIVGNIYCYYRYDNRENLYHPIKEVTEDGKKKDMLDFHTVESSKEYEIPQEIKTELYNRAKKICEQIIGRI